MICRNCIVSLIHPTSNLLPPCFHLPPTAFKMSTCTRVFCFPPCHKCKVSHHKITPNWKHGKEIPLSWAQRFFLNCKVKKKNPFLWTHTHPKKKPTHKVLNREIENFLLSSQPMLISYPKTARDYEIFKCSFSFASAQSVALLEVFQAPSDTCAVTPIAMRSSQLGCYIFLDIFFFNCRKLGYIFSP